MREADGSYRYIIGFDRSDQPVTDADKQTAEWRQGLRDNNVIAQFHADGSVSVKKGGMFTRARNFRTIDDFSKEVNGKIDSYVNHYKQQENRRRSGYISQIAAENLKTELKSKETGMALRSFGKQMKSEIHSAKVQATAAQDMKARVNRVIDEARKKTRKR